MTWAETFTFLRPAMLFLLLPLAAIWLHLRWLIATPPPPVANIAPHLLAALTTGRDRASRAVAPDFLIGAAMLMTVAAAGPAWRAAPSPFVSETAPVVIAVDLSPSMSGTDIAPSRLERATQKIRDFIESRAGGRAGLIAYAGTAHLVMPLTDDPSVLLPFLEALDPGIMPVAGRDASAALTLAQTLLASEVVPGSVLFVTDDIDPSQINAFPQDHPALAALIVAPDGGGASVQQWSRAAGVTTVPVSVDDSDLTAIDRALTSSLARAAAEAGLLQDDGWMLSIPAGLLLLLWFRRGVTLRWGALMLVLALPVSEPAQAEGLADWFWTPDQQGATLYAANDFPEAAAAFADPMWQAAALFRTGQYDQAAALLEPVQTAEAQINRGIALAHGRSYPQALAAFEAAQTLDPDNATAAANIDKMNQIIAYLTSERAAEDDDQSNTADDTVNDLDPDADAQRITIDADSQLSEDSADQWMRQVQTDPADFLKLRFASEAAAGGAP